MSHWPSHSIGTLSFATPTFPYVSYINHVNFMFSSCGLNSKTYNLHASLKTQQNYKFQQKGHNEKHTTDFLSSIFNATFQSSLGKCDIQ